MFEASKLDSLPLTAAEETAQTAPLNATEEYRVIPLELIDEPPEPMRETMDELVLAELADSILAVGQRVPGEVKAVGGRFQIISGHRRYLACKIAGCTTYKALVTTDSSSSDLAKMIAENSGREDVNPVEEARLYGRVLTELCGGDVDVLVRTVRRRREYVERRLLLLAGDEKVLAALAHRHISMGIADQLNQVNDPDRRLVLLDAAVRGGATVRTVMEWRIAANQAGVLMPAPPDTTGTDSQPQHIDPSAGFVCMFCQDGDDVHLMELLYLHRQCKKFVLRLLQRETPQPAEQ